MLLSPVNLDNLDTLRRDNGWPPIGEPACICIYASTPKNCPESELWLWSLVDMKYKHWEPPFKEDK